jgi:hypothetical protein
MDTGSEAGMTDYYRNVMPVPDQVRHDETRDPLILNFLISINRRKTTPL